MGAGAVTCSPRSLACSYSASSSSVGGSDTCGPYSSTRSAAAKPKCSSAMLLELFDAQGRLGFRDLVAVQRVGQRGDPGGELARLLAHLGQCVGAKPALGGQFVPVAGGGGDGLRSASPRPAGPPRPPRRQPSRHAHGPPAPVARAAGPRVRWPLRGAANPPGPERRSPAPRRSAPQAGPPPRRPVRPRQRRPAPAGGSARPRTSVPAARCATGSRARSAPRPCARGWSPARRAGSSAAATPPRRPGRPGRVDRAARRSTRSRRRIR